MAITTIEARTAEAHKRIQDWRRKHPNGYLINYKSPNNAILHRSECPIHLGDTEWDADNSGLYSLGNKTKILSMSKEELIQWLRVGNISYRPCGHCKP